MVTTVSEFTSAAVSDRGLNESRPQNEDSYLELSEHGLFAVADGVGGAQAGEVASQMAVEILGEAFANMSENADPEDTMRIALERANEAIFQMSNDIPQLSSMATTIVAVHISGDMATIGHVGDSRVYRIDGNGKLVRETDDHSVVEEEVRAGRMTPEQALNHPSRNVISRALGAENSVVPDIKCVLVHPGTTFLLCSDGITRHIDDAEIEQLLRSEFGPEDICVRMKEICFSRGAEDNLTAVVLRFPGDLLVIPSMAESDDDGIEEVTLAGVREPSLVDADRDETSETATAKYEFEEGWENDSSQTTDGPDARLEEPSDEMEYRPTELGYRESESEASSTEVPRTAENSSVNQFTAPPVSSYEAAPNSAVNGNRARGGLLGLLFAAGLIVGALLGFGASYLLRSTPAVVEVPPAPVQQSDNIPRNSFETGRRLVDEDPVGYLNSNAATPQEADDFFWLGRALMLTGKPVEARRQFEEARSRLASFDDRASAKTMANEISMALALLDSPQARENFVRELNSSSSANANTNASGPAR